MMNIPRARLDMLAAAMLEAGLKKHGNPVLRIVARMASSHINQALEETFGPRTKAGEIAKRLVSAADEFKRKFIEAHRQIEQEDGR